MLCTGHMTWLEFGSVTKTKFLDEFTVNINKFKDSVYSNKVKLRISTLRS